MCCLGQNLWLVGQALFSNFNKSSPTDGLRIIVVTFVVIACRFPFASWIRKSSKAGCLPVVVLGNSSLFHAWCALPSNQRVADMCYV